MLMMPAVITRTDGGCGGCIGPRRDDHERGWSPCRPIACMARRPDETPEPTHRNSEPGRVIIARTGDDGNRKQAGNFTPLPPAMKLLQIIRSHQPDEAPLGVAADHRAARIDRTSVV